MYKTWRKFILHLKVIYTIFINVSIYFFFNKNKNLLAVVLVLLLPIIESESSKFKRISQIFKTYTLSSESNLSNSAF